MERNDFKYFVRYRNRYALNNFGTNYFTSLEDAKEDCKNYDSKNYYVALHQIPLQESVFDQLKRLRNK